MCGRWNQAHVPTVPTDQAGPGQDSRPQRGRDLGTSSTSPHQAHRQPHWSGGDSGGEVCPNNDGSPV